MTEKRAGITDEQRRMLFEQLRSEAGRVPRIEPTMPYSSPGAAALREGLKAAIPAPIEIDVDETPIGRSALASERTAESVDKMASLTRTIVDLAEQSLTLSESAREDARRSERFAKIMSWTSTVIAAASLAAAIVAIVVTSSTA